MADNFLRTGEVAVLFGVSRRTVEKWCVEGFIVARKWNKRWLIDRAMLQKQWHNSYGIKAKTANEENN